MSVLLDDIIESATDGQQSLSDLLRKCLRLGHELKNERLKAWANQELSGYRSSDDLVDYRIIPAGAKGNFECPLGRQYTHHIIPPAVMEKNHQHFAKTVRLVQSVSAYEGMSRSVNRIITFPWPADMVGYYQEKLMRSCVCHSAWQEISPGALVEMLDIVRHRTLKLALEIKDELGTAYTSGNLDAAEKEKVHSIIVQNLGGTNYQNFGESNLAASIYGTTIIAAGDLKALESKLEESGLTKSDLQALGDAIDADGKKLGPRVVTWIEAHAPKVISAGLKVGAKIGQEVLTHMLMQYLGIK